MEIENGSTEPMYGALSHDRCTLIIILCHPWQIPEQPTGINPQKHPQSTKTGQSSRQIKALNRCEPFQSALKGDRSYHVLKIL